MALAGGAVAASGAAVASAAFRYNRANYQFDEGGMRFNRFTTGYNQAQTQVKMYRDDIKDLTTLTVTKQDTFHTVGTIFYVLNFQLIMAGRLGVHGPSPPGWLLGLYWTNICSALMYLTTFTWMAMHASARAQAGAAFLRTRKVRLPIPTPKQLDQARTTGNTFEKQRLADMFRIPFVAPAPKDQRREEKVDDVNRDVNRRIPRWYQDDEIQELHAGSGGKVGSNPEHFELHRGLHEEFWAYDVYSRVGVLYFMSHWLTSASLYSQCHVFTELRCIWPAWTVTACFVAAHYGVLAVDIVDKPSKGLGLPVEKVVPFVPFLTVAGMTIDYSVLTPSVGAQSFVYALGWIAYLIQFAWAWRLLDLASPAPVQAKDDENKEVPGRPWTPKEWLLPPAFREAVYVVSAPTQTEQPCLLQQLASGSAVQDEPSTLNKLRTTDPSCNFAWKLFRGACITTIAMWSLILCGRVFEQANGERMLLKQEGRVERWPSHMQPWMAPWSRFGTRNEWCHAGGCDRRLSMEEADISVMAKQLMTTLQPLAHALEAKRSGPAVPIDPLVSTEFAWPDGFSPVHLTSNGDVVAALANDHRGAMLQVTEAPTAVPFTLQGISTMGGIHGATLANTGLLLIMTSGALAECTGVPVGGVWPCKQLSAKLPISGSQLKAAAVSRIGGSGILRAALTLSDDEDSSLLILETEEAKPNWSPAGEVRFAAANNQVHLSMSSEAVFISAGNGEVLKWPFQSTEPTEQVAAAQPLTGGSRMMWHAACPLSGNRVAHLATQPNEAAPKLYVRAARA